MAASVLDRNVVQEGGHVSGTADRQAFSSFQAEYPPVFEARFSAGRGLRLIREDGAEFLDGVSGTFSVPLGYDHPKVVEAVIEQLRKCAHMSSSYSAPYARSVLVKLLSVAPPNIGAGWMRDLTGSTANECAIKIAQKSTGKRDVLSLHQSHHGQTVFTTSISGEAFRRAAFPIIPNASSIKVPPPYCYRCPYDSVYPGCGLLCAERIYDAIEYGSSGSVACMLVEPVLGNGGNIVPPSQLLLCRSANR
jgi:4-aminobutyrate aminotransferase-like enzyme